MAVSTSFAPGAGVLLIDSELIKYQSNDGNGTFNTLSPRQAVTPAPYAIYSANAGTAITAASAAATAASDRTGAAATAAASSAIKS